MDLTIREDLLIGLTDIQKCDYLIKEGNNALAQTTMGYMKFGLILEKLIGKDGAWRSYAKGIDNKSEFVRDAFKLSLSMCSHIRRVTKTFAPYIGDKTIPFYRLLNAAPLVKADKVEVKEAIEQASSLEPVAWDTQVKVWKGKPDRDLCFHEKTELWERCSNPDCGKWIKKIGTEDKPKCKWVYDEEYEKWDTDCGNTFVLNDGTPADNGMVFCPYCGNILEV